MDAINPSSSRWVIWLIRSDGLAIDLLYVVTRENKSKMPAKNNLADNSHVVNTHAEGTLQQSKTRTAFSYHNFSKIRSA